MENIHEQAVQMLKRQVERQADDPLNNVRKEAVCRILPMILEADGFTILIASAKNGKTEGLALSGGLVREKETLEELLTRIIDVASGLNIPLEITAQCVCPECAAAREAEQAGNGVIHYQ